MSRERTARYAAALARTACAAFCLGSAGALMAHPVDSADERSPLVMLAAAEPGAPQPETGAEAGIRRWLAGDHHVHSRYSVGYEETDPPQPILGGDAIYPIPMNAVMARRFGLSWMVATDHGGPNHAKISHDHAYPELLLSREAVPELMQFFGMELNTPGADHSSVIIPQGANEAEHLHEIEHQFDKNEMWPRDPARDSETRMIAALDHMDALSPKPVVIAHHPSRSATGIGQYGQTSPAELRNWNDAAPDVAIGMEGSPGHQAAALQTRPLGSGEVLERRPRGFYANSPTMGGFDQMTARLGGFWDSMLAEGRRWWITASSDSHVHWSDGGADFWPGEYSKTYVLAQNDPASILAGLRGGAVFVTTGDLVSEMELTATAGSAEAGIGQALAFRPGEDVRIRIRVRDPAGANNNGDNPSVARIDLIRGEITGPEADRASDRNPTTRVEARFDAETWQRDGEYISAEYVLKGVSDKEYIRVRGTNGAEPEPEPDAIGEDPWSDLWFYSNPVFLTAATQ